MLRWAALLFVVVPLVDAGVLLWLATKVGVLPVIGLVIVSLAGGVLAASRQAGGVWRRWRESVERGTPPEEGVLGGVLALLGGALLAVPGLISDALGLALLVPPVRRYVAHRIRTSFEERVARGQIRVTTVQVGPAGATYTERGGGGPARSVHVAAMPPVVGDVIETEGEVVEEPKALPESTGGGPG